MQMQCPICESQETRRFAAIRGIEIHRCRHCEHGFALFSQHYEEPKIQEMYSLEFSGYRNDPYYQNAIREEIRTNILPLVTPPARVLDIGCGNGEFLLAAQEAGYTVLGYDVSQAALTICESRGLPVQGGDLMQVSSAGSFDIITLWNVIIYLSEPRRTLQQAYHLLRPVGLLVLRTSILNRREMRVVRVCPRLAFPILQIPSQLHFFSESSLEQLLGRCGFQQVQRLPSRRLHSQPRRTSLKRRLKGQCLRTIRAYARADVMHIACQKPAHH